jgi:hypothetical protein
MHENSDFLRLVVNSIRKDLDSNNEIDNCLALHAIANVGGSEMAEALVEDVHRLLISPCVTHSLLNVPRLIWLKDLSEFCEKKGCIDALAPLPQASRSHSCRRMGITDCVSYG